METPKKTYYQKNKARMQDNAKVYYQQNKGKILAKIKKHQKESGRIKTHKYATTDEIEDLSIIDEFTVIFSDKIISAF